MKHPPAYPDGLFGVFNRPMSAAAHEILATSYQALGNGIYAKLERDVAGQLSSVLGATTVETEKRRAADIDFWKNTVSNFPDYPDAYIQLAHLAYIKGNVSEAVSYLKQAAALLPNNDFVKNVLKIISP